MKQKDCIFFKKAFGILLMLGLVIYVKEPVFAVTQAELANPAPNESTHFGWKEENSMGYYWHNGTHETTYHYIYFGYYPQKELIGNEITDEIRKATYNSNGDAVINGRKYRRLTWEMNSVTGTINERTRENWNQYSDNGYRYFEYEPIKWQILNNDGTKLFLFSDQCLDQQSLHNWSDRDSTWESLYLRKWLNYDGTKELDLPRHYKSKGFMDFAFSKEEQNRIQTTYVEQDANPKYTNSDGSPCKNGENTYDKIFLLSCSEISNKQYGFCDTGIDNEPDGCFSRRKQGTDYATALGRFFEREDSVKSYWTYWLRTKGKRGCDVMEVYPSSSIASAGETIEMVRGVAPAMNVSYNLSDCIKVTFNTNGAGTIEDQIFLGSNYAKEPKVPVKQGYVFSGWYTDSACTVSYKFNQKLTKDTTLYAAWKKEEQASNNTSAITENTIIAMEGDGDIKGSSFCKIQARANKVTKNSVSLKWNRVKGADGYCIYGNKCGTKNKYKRIKTLENGTKVSYTQNGLKKGTYYKYIVRAYKKVNGEKVTIAASKTIHVTTNGGRYGNAKEVRVNKNKTTVTLKKGKKYNLKAKEIKKSKKIKKHRAICYESSNTKIATVSKKGVITAKGKGSCTIYAYAQNGIFKKIKVKVK